MLCGDVDSTLGQLKKAEALGFDRSTFGMRATDYRNVVGRAYYAAFHAVAVFHAFLPQPGILPSKTTGHHEELFHRLINPAIPAVDPRHRASRIIGHKARDFHRIRVKADYDLAEEMKSEDARNAIARAEEIFELIEKAQPK